MVGRPDRPGSAATSALAADPVQIGVGYLGVAGTRSTLSLVEQPAENDGVAGARLAIEDNNTTGKFLNQRFTLEERGIKGKAKIRSRLRLRLPRKRLHHRRPAGRRAVEGLGCPA